MKKPLSSFHSLVLSDENLLQPTPRLKNPSYKRSVHQNKPAHSTRPPFPFRVMRSAKTLTTMKPVRKPDYRLENVMKTGHPYLHETEEKAQEYGHPTGCFPLQPSRSNTVGNRSGNGIRLFDPAQPQTAHVQTCNKAKGTVHYSPRCS